MTHEQHQKYLKLAFQAVGYSFTDEMIETIILTTTLVKTKKGQFNMMNAANIIAAMQAKYNPEPEPVFDELEQLEHDRE